MILLFKNRSIVDKKEINKSYKINKMSDEDFLVKGMSPGDNKISAINLTTENMLTKTLDNDKEGFYLVDYNNIEIIDKIEIKRHILWIKTINEELYNKRNLIMKNYVNDTYTPINKNIKHYFLFYNKILIGYKLCSFEINDKYILCYPYQTCSFTEILKKGGYLDCFKKSSVTIMLEKIKELFKVKLYFPIYSFQSEKSCESFLKNNFKIVLIDDNLKTGTGLSSINTILIPTDKNVKEFIDKHKNTQFKDFLLKKVIENTNLHDILLPKENEFFSHIKTINGEDDNILCFLIYSPEPDDGKKRKSKKKLSKKRKSKKRRKSRN